jgi:hypothetical protein
MDFSQSLQYIMLWFNINKEMWKTNKKLKDICKRPFRINVLGSDIYYIVVRIFDHKLKNRRQMYGKDITKFYELYFETTELEEREKILNAVSNLNDVVNYHDIHRERVENLVELLRTINSHTQRYGLNVSLDEIKTGFSEITNQ